MKKFPVLILITLLIVACSEKKDATKAYDLFVGVYTDGDSEGIYKLTFNGKTGALSQKTLATELRNPSFLAISKDQKNLYAVQEIADFDSIGGGVSAFSLVDGKLNFLNSKGTAGEHPCHVALSNDGQLAASNYTGGNLSVFDLVEDGSLGDRQVLDHKTIDSLKTPHVHKAHFNEDGLFVADLGLDAVKRYTKQAYGWVPAHQASINMAKGAGPRHFEFSKNRDFLYIINELSSKISVLKRDDEGSYNEVQLQPTLALDYDGDNSCADIHLSPDGKFLYGSNRGENTIVVFSVDQKTGKLSTVGRSSVNGDWPRNFSIDPTGNFLLVANQKSSNITVYSRDADKGLLEFKNKFKIDSPVCLLFLAK